MRIHYFQHVPFEELGIIQKWAESRGHNVTVTKFFSRDKLPKIEEIDWLIVMGGPMGVYDEKIYPWLREEKHFIARAIQQQRKVLGICLGAQLIASALGAKVYTNSQKEIGWYPVQLTSDGKKSKYFQNFPGHFTAFHWHGDTFDLPKGAQWLAESEACQHQAFSLGNNVLGLQFHLEVAKENVELLIKYCGHELHHAPFIPLENTTQQATESYHISRSRDLTPLVSFRTGFIQTADQILSPNIYFKEMDKQMIQILVQFEK